MPKASKPKPLFFSVRWLFPSRTQWQQWTLPSKFTFVGMWLGMVGAIGIPLTILIYFLSKPPLPSEDVLRNDVLRNLEILNRKIIVADDLYRNMRQTERNNTPNPYVYLADRMKRDLPPFDLNRALRLEDSDVKSRQPFRTYLKAYEQFRGMEDLEQFVVMLFHRVTDGYYDRRFPDGSRVTDIRGVAVYGIQLGGLERTYLANYHLVQGYLKEIGVDAPDAPTDLYLLTEPNPEEKSPRNSPPPTK